MTKRLLAKPWMKWLGYPAFFNVALLGFFYLSFPYEALRDRIVHEARDRAGLELEIGSVRLAGVTGLVLRDVAMRVEDDGGAAAAAEGGAEGEAPAPAGPQKITVDRVQVNAEVLPLLRGDKAFSFEAEAWGGELSGRFEKGKEKQVIAARGERFLLAKSPLRALAGLDLEGLVSSFELELASDGKDFSKANGKLVLKGESLTLNGGDVQGFELPKIVLGTLDARVPVEAGKATVEAFTISGADLEAQLESTVIRLAPRLASSSLVGKLKVRPSDEWWNRNEMLKNMANFALPAGKDGWRTINLTGQLQKPGFRPQK